MLLSSQEKMERIAAQHEIKLESAIGKQEANQDRLQSRHLRLGR
jgi:hypothetical protein